MTFDTFLIVFSQIYLSNEKNVLQNFLTYNGYL